MTLKTFLSTKNDRTKVRIELQLSEFVEPANSQNAILKPHLFDVVSWRTEMDNYEPIVVVLVR